MKKRTVLTFLSQSSAGGVIGSFLVMCVLVLSYPNAHNFELVFVLPIVLFLGAIIGTAAGAVIWTTESFIRGNWRILSRIGISVLLPTLPFVGLIFDQETHDQRLLLFALASFAAFGLPIGLLTGSSVQPWHLIALGPAARPRLKVLFRRGPIRISRTIEELRFSFLAGLPLRAASGFALTASLLLAACTLSFVWWNWWSFKTLEDLFEDLVATTYFGATVAVSFTASRKLVVLIIAALVNVPWAIWMVGPDEPDAQPIFARILVAIFIVLWLPFLTGRLFSPTKQGALQVEYHPGIRFGRQQWVKEIR